MVVLGLSFQRFFVKYYNIYCQSFTTAILQAYEEKIEYVWFIQCKHAVLYDNMYSYKLILIQLKVAIGIK